MIFSKPNNYDNVSVGGSYEKLTPGGHRCMIMAMQTSVSKSGKDMIVLHLDTMPDDAQPGFFSKKFKDDTRPNKSWGCTMYTMIADDHGDTSKAFKSLITSVEDSNRGFTAPWGKSDTEFCAAFKGKKVGIVFREEEYMGNDGKVRSSCKPFYCRAIDKVLDEPVPEVKKVANTAHTTASNAPFDPFGASSAPQFVEIKDGDSLPF